MMFDKEKKYRQIDFNKMNGPLLVYSFKYGKIIDANKELANLFGFSNSNELLEDCSYDLTKLINKETLDSLESNYDNGIYFFTSYFHCFLDGAEHHFKMITDIQIQKNAAYCLVEDITLQYEEKIKNEVALVDKIKNYNSVLGPILKLYSSVFKINLKTFESYQIKVINDSISCQKMTVDWNEYLEFFLMLVDSKDYNNIKEACSKDGLINLEYKETKSFNYVFEASFDISTGERSLSKSKLNYSLYLTQVIEDKVPYALIFIKNETDKFHIKDDNNLLSSYLVDYSSIFFVDYDSLDVKLFSTTNTFPSVVNKLANIKKYNELAKYYNTNFVYPEDRIQFFENTNINNVKKVLESRNSYIVNYRRLINYNVDKASIYFFKSKDENGKNRIILAIRTVYANELMNDYTKDSLTGLMSFNSFVKAVSKITENDKTGYMLRFDIDHFTVFNNMFGLVEGDRLLQNIGDYLTGLSKIFDIQVCHVFGDVFGVYLKGDVKTLDKFVNHLQNGIFELSDLFDIRISIGACKFDENTSIHYLFDCCLLAESKLKGKYAKTYLLYSESLRNEAKLKLNRVKKVTEAIKQKEFDVKFRKIYDINSSLKGFDTGLFLNDKSINLGEYNLFTFLENNGLIVNLNKMISEYINSLINQNENESINKYSFVIYVSKYYLENDKLLRELLKQIKSSKINNANYILTIQANNDSFSSKVIKTLEEFRKENVIIMMDYSNCMSFDFKILNILKIKSIKLDALHFVYEEKLNIDVLLGIVELFTSFNCNVLVAHATNEIIEKLKEVKNREFITYTLNENLVDGDKLKDF